VLCSGAQQWRIEIMSNPDIVLYGSIFSRTFTARWMLAELDLPYRLEVVDIRKGQQKEPDFLQINPMGKVPAITDHGVVVTETAAICLYLADRYGYGQLTPRIEEPERGSYCRWLVFSTAVLEPAIRMKDVADPDKGRGVGWGTYETAVSVAEQALTPGPYLLGERFTAADVAFGAVLAVAMFNKGVPDRPAFRAHNERITQRPAYGRAAAENWPSAEIAKLS
jgi:glutathione S-transferase